MGDMKKIHFPKLSRRTHHGKFGHMDNAKPTHASDFFEKKMLFMFHPNACVKLDELNECLLTRGA